MISWTNFLLSVSLIYLGYYSIQLCLDAFELKGRVNQLEESEPLFELTDQPEVIGTTEPTSQPDPFSSAAYLQTGPVESSGQVELLTLQTLATLDALQLIRTIPM